MSETLFTYFNVLPATLSLMDPSQLLLEKIDSFANQLKNSFEVTDDEKPRRLIEKENGEFLALKLICDEQNFIDASKAFSRLALKKKDQAIILMGLKFLSERPDFNEKQAYDHFLNRRKRDNMRLISPHPRSKAVH